MKTQLFTFINVPVTFIFQLIDEDFLRLHLVGKYTLRNKAYFFLFTNLSKNYLVLGTYKNMISKISVRFIILRNA